MYEQDHFFLIYQNWLSRFYLYARWHQGQQKFYLIHEHWLDKLIGIFAKDQRVKRLKARIHMHVLADWTLEDHVV